MKAGVIRFPGSNCDRDCYDVLKHQFGFDTRFLWHKDHDLSGLDLIVLPGGFSYGDYLRCGAIARFSPIMQEVMNFAEKGGLVAGICNGFQILTEAKLLPGALVRNKNMQFICKYLHLRVENTDYPFTSAYNKHEVINVPIAHGEGNYIADDTLWDELVKNNQIVFRYCGPNGEISDEYNPNGSRGNVAGIVNKAGNVLGMMPHPERASEAIMHSTCGYNFFAGIKAFLGGKGAV